MNLTLYYQVLNSTLSEIMLKINFKAIASMKSLLTALKEHNDMKIRVYVQNVQFEVSCSLHIFICKDETNKNNFEN